MQPESEEFARVSAILGNRPVWWLMVLEYGITHSRMVVALHQRDYPKGLRLELLEPYVFEGVLRGGPYVLELSESEHAGGPALELADADGKLRILFESLRVMARVE